MYKKVLLTQFCIPSLDTLEYKSNVHLAPGYLVGFAKGMLPNTEFVITPRVYTDLLTENAFIDYVLNQEPDLLVFSLYLWNIDKTLRVVEKIKAVCPKAEFLFGGPEVNADNRYLLNSESFTEGISGEGEIPFLDYLLGKPKSGIAGLLTKDSFNDFEAIRTDYKIETNPYLENLIETKPDNTMFFETVRGCPFSCNFCYYNKVYSKIISVGREHLAEYFEYARNNDFKELFLLDPTFNVQPDFDGLLDDISELNKDKRFEISTELRSDFLTDSQIEKLTDINLVEAEIGLQTTNPRALEAMSRKDRTAKTIERTKKMYDAGINCKVDLIVGLPGDSLEDFKKSVDDVFAEGLHEMIQVFRLSILPGTEFAVNSKKFGIIADKQPPYYIQSTPTFSEADIREALDYAEEVFDVSLYPLAPFLLSTDFSELDRNDFVQFDTVNDNVSGTLNHTTIEPIHKIIFENYDGNLEQYDSRFCETLVLHFKVGKSTTADQINSVLSYFRENHPNSTYQIIIDFEDAPRVNLIEKVSPNLPRSNRSYLEKDSYANIGVYLGVSARLAVIVPVTFRSSEEVKIASDMCDLFFKIDEFSEELIDELYEEMPVDTREELAVERNLFFAGNSQAQAFDSLKAKDLIDDYVIFDSFKIEKERVDCERRYYFPGLISL
jgi:radical SAM superfamily enzyme YgiQ (UPF0313 family)